MTWDDIKFYGYGLLKLSPSELFTMTVHEIFDMVSAYYRRRDDELDEQLTVLAWQTSLIMNSSGNYKKAIKPKDLYKAKGDGEEESENELRPIDVEEKNKELQALQDKFNKDR
jgi:hypothetical protein